MKLIIICAVVISCGLWFACKGNSVKPNLKAIAGKPGTVVVDVRTPEEFAAGHFEGAVNIPLQILADSVEKLKKYEDVIVVCRSGARSAKAKALLEQHGLKNVHDGGGWEAFRKKVSK